MGWGDRGYLKDTPVRPSCPQSSEALVRKGHLTGLKPVVIVTFQSPVNFNRWKLEHLQIQMEAAPFRSKGEPKGHLERSQAWQEHEGLLGTSERGVGIVGIPQWGMWRRVWGGLSRFQGSDGATQRPQWGPWP